MSFSDKPSVRRDNSLIVFRETTDMDTKDQTTPDDLDDTEVLEQLSEPERARLDRSEDTPTAPLVM